METGALDLKHSLVSRDPFFVIFFFFLRFFCLPRFNALPDLGATMHQVLEMYGAQAVDYNVDSTKEDAATAQAKATGYWGPWLDAQGRVLLKP